MHHFILGDFFVVDDSNVNFDERLTLKEDYDYTCAHLQVHGSVMRCNRMVVHAKHNYNDGGAVTTRDKKGHEEQRNIEILQSKWPQAILPHATRKNEMKLRWPLDGGTT